MGVSEGPAQCGDPGDENDLPQPLTYQERTRAYAMYPRGKDGLNYLALKLGGESGEVLELFGKALRVGIPYDSPQVTQPLKKELGDILWYVARMADENGWTLEEIMELNIEKLRARKVAGTLSSFEKRSE